MILALERLRQEIHESVASLGYTVSPPYVQMRMLVGTGRQLGRQAWACRRQPVCKNTAREGQCGCVIEDGKGGAAEVMKRKMAT